MNMNAPMVAKVTSPDYIEPSTTMSNSSSEDDSSSEDESESE